MEGPADAAAGAERWIFLMLAHGYQKVALSVASVNASAIARKKARRQRRTEYSVLAADERHT